MRKAPISKDEYEQIVAAEKRCKDKRTSKKLSILLVRLSGKTIGETAKQMMCSESTVKRITAEYLANGLEEVMRNKYKANHRSWLRTSGKTVLATTI